VGGDRVIIVECDPVTRGRHGILREIAKALGVPHVVDRRGNYTRQDIRDAIVDKLSGSRDAGGTGILVVLNEAHLLDYNAVELFRRLLDKAATGGVLVGTQRLATQLEGRGKLMYEQIRRRCIAVRAFRQIDDVPLADVKAVAESVACGKLRADVVRALCDECNSTEPGHLGKLGRVAALVHEAMALAGGEITTAAVANAITLLAA